MTTKAGERPAFLDNKHLMAAAAAIVSFAVMLYFHDRFWWAPDDGAYGYVAQRMLRGDVLNVDVRDIHAGYIHFVHLAAFWLFGEDLLSLRYPLAAMTVIQSVIAFYLVSEKGLFAAFAAALAAACLSLVMFVNPTANWYTLFMAFALAGVLAWTKPGTARRYVLAGFVVGLAILLRQLSGVFLAMAAVVIAIIEQHDEDAGRSVLARLALGAIAIVVLAYFASKQSTVALVLFGIWPLAVVLVAAIDARVSEMRMLRISAWLAAGAFIAALPLFLYLLMHGSAVHWYRDAIAAAFGLHGMDFIRQQNFAFSMLYGLGAVLRDISAVALLNLFFWFLLLAAPVALGMMTLRKLRSGEAVVPLCIIAVFLGQTPAHYQIPNYLAFPTSLTLVALIAIMSARWRTAAATIVCILCATALLFQAAQPVSRGLAGIMRGDRGTLDNARYIERASIRIEAREAETYRRILALIGKHTSPQDPILAMPFIPEFYFLPGRPSIYKSIGIPFEFPSEADLPAALAIMTAKAPKVVVHRRDDKYNTPVTLGLVVAIRERYGEPVAIDDFDVYIAPVK